ncbi:MAG: alpha-E domain-containing protein [Anaerolineae bacterium]|nr:alpha-E domain-containing protein [Anaerolineae bacterium]
MLSRVADNLYWMSRYLERAEHCARVLDVHMNLILEQPDPAGQRMQRLANCFNFPPPEDGFFFVRDLAFNPENRVSIVSCIAAARENARQVRERISSEMWQELNRLYIEVKHADSGLAFETEPHVFFQIVKSGAHMFQGITDSTVSHGEGWHFIQLGRYIERVIALSTLVDAYFQDFDPAGTRSNVTIGDYFEWLGMLKSCTAFEAYSKVYTADLRPALVAEFLILNDEFPHSVRFSVDQMQNALSMIADTTETRKSGRVHRLVGRLRAALSYNQIDEIMADSLHDYLMDIQHQCAEIHNAAYETFIAYPITPALA